MHKDFSVTCAEIHRGCLVTPRASDPCSGQEKCLKVVLTAKIEARKCAARK